MIGLHCILQNECTLLFYIHVYYQQCSQFIIYLQSREVKSCLLVSSIVTSPLIPLNEELQLQPVAGYPLVSSIFAVQVALQAVDTHLEPLLHDERYSKSLT